MAASERRGWMREIKFDPLWLVVYPPFLFFRLSFARRGSAAAPSTFEASNACYDVRIAPWPSVVEGCAPRPQNRSAPPRATSADRDSSRRVRRPMRRLQRTLLNVLLSTGGVGVRKTTGPPALARPPRSAPLPRAPEDMRDLLFRLFSVKLTRLLRLRSPPRSTRPRWTGCSNWLWRSARAAPRPARRPPCTFASLT